MMTTLKNKECGNGPKKTFAPPAQKLYCLIPCSSNSPKKETLGIGSSEAKARPSPPKARLKKEEDKATIENGPRSCQEKTRKAQDNKQAKKKEKEKSSLTNAEFEEIVQIVLQKSLQECVGMGSGHDFTETSCAWPVACTQSDKEPGIAPSATDDDTDGERIVVPHTQGISASREDEIVPEIKTCKLSQPDPAPSEKKFNRLSLSKRKKEARDEKVEKVQGGHEHRQKDQPKKMVQGHSQCRDEQKEGRNGFDLEYNHCDIPEETWTGCENDVAYASYVPGSIIWAKQYGYPWWPGMIESDPDLGEYFLFASRLDSLPSKYHVTFFGETVSRAWIPVNMLKNFQELSLEQAGVKKGRKKDCSQKLGAALMMAQEAEQISIQERVNLFGFQSRYNGSDSGEERDVMLSGANSPNSCLEEEEEEEEEEKKDPTLSSPKPAKIQTKKPKPRGMADGQDGTLQRKTVKRSLGDKSTAPSSLLMGKKEGQKNSDSDQPGPKKKFKAPQSKASATSFSEEKEARMVPKGLSPPACGGARASVGKEEPRPQEPLPQETGSAPPEDEASSELDLEQLMEDTGEELEQREEPQPRDDGEDFTMPFLEE
ncbi:zinc finger CW-type PWWP domain protein 1 isoform X3 [Cynocephalus volans]|uniref:zinc finger CW-type PWWP domain protein 1 isoform X3 n=1 Tax=Cynocephalus volans TaxID=110931 RepID=UPI002FC7A879